MRPHNARGPPGTRSGTRPTHALRHKSSTNSQILERLLPASARLPAPALGAQREHRRGRHAQAAACRATSTGTSRLVFVFEYAHRLAASAAEVLERLLPSCGGSMLARTKNLPLPLTLPRHSTPNPCALLGRPSSPKMPAKNHPLLPSVPVHMVVGFYLNFYHHSPESFKPRALRRIEVASAHFWTSVYLYSKSRSCIELHQHSDLAS